MRFRTLRAWYRTHTTATLPAKCGWNLTDLKQRRVLPKIAGQQGRQVNEPGASDQAIVVRLGRRSTDAIGTQTRRDLLPTIDALAVATRWVRLPMEVAKLLDCGRELVLLKILAQGASPGPHKDNPW